MSKKSEFEVYTDANRESDVFAFSEAENEKQFLNENFVFKDEDNASQTSYDTNASQYGNEDNISGESSYKEDNFDNSDRKDNQNSQNSSSNTSSTSTSSASTASSSAASSSAASTAASTAASGGSVLATVATTATVAVVAVVGGGEIINQTFKKPKFFEFQDVLVVENTVSFSLIIDPENPEVDLDEPEDTDCYVEVSYKMPERYFDQVEVKKFGVFESEFKDLDYDTEYCLRLYRPGLLGAEKEYLRKEESIYEYVFKTWPKGEEAVSTESIVLSETSIILTTGNEFALTSTVLPEDASNTKVYWKSSNEEVASVHDGLVYGVSAGTATITAYQGNIEATCSVTVTDGIATESIELSDTELSLYIGEEHTITANVLPENASNKDVVWTSTDPEVATVENGVITALSTGYTIISATQGNVESTCRVTVSEKVVPVQSVSFENEELTMEVGNIVELPAIIAPENFTDEVIWSSSDRNVATVNGLPDDPSIGEIYATSSGDITITVSAGEYSATCLLHVVPKRVPTESITLNYEELSLLDNGYKTLEYTVNPWNTTDEPQWSKDVEGVVEFTQIRSNECQVHAIGGGTVTVRCTSGEYYAECMITVETIPVEGLAFEKESYTLLYDETLTVGVIVTPNNANQKLVFIPGDDSIISVDSKGVVTAIGIGETTLTVKTEDGTFEAECNIYVNQRIDVNGVDLSASTMSLTIGGGDESIGYLNVIVLPENATNQEVTWSSDNESIATVTQDDEGRGVVTAVGVGEATITVSTAEGEFTDECIVYVNEPQIEPEIEPVTGVTLNENSIELNLTDADSSTRQLTATVLPENATNKVVSWSSENESIATVDQDGLVTGVGSGETTIIVTTEDGQYTAECIVYVNEPQIEPQIEPVTGVTLNENSIELNLTDADSSTRELTATVLPENATNKVVSWSSENENVATVDQNGLVTGVGSGETIIIVTTEDGQYRAECHVTVIVPEPVVTSFMMNVYTSDAGNSFPIIDFEFDDPAGAWGNQFQIRIQPDDNESAITKDMLPAGQYMDCFNYDGAFYLPEISDDDVTRIISNSCTATVILASESSFNNAIYDGALVVNNDNHTFAAPSYSYQEENNPASVDPTFYATVNLNSGFYSVYTNVRVVLKDTNSDQQFEVNINEFDTDVVTGATITLDSQAYDVSVYGYKSGNSSEVLIFSERVTDFQLH